MDKYSHLFIMTEHNSPVLFNGSDPLACQIPVADVAMRYFTFGGGGGGWETVKSRLSIEISGIMLLDIMTDSSENSCHGICTEQDWNQSPKTPALKGVSAKESRNKTMHKNFP
jgi:hypothetical protein